MSIAFSRLGMSSQEFWHEQTIVEWDAALRGLMMENGIDPDIKPMTHERLMELHERFPDYDRSTT